MNVLRKPNPKPFWKEPSLKHVWYRLNDGGKVVVGAFLYLLFSVMMGFIGGPDVGFWFVTTGAGFGIGWCVRDLLEPVWIQDEVTGEYKRIEFPAEDE